MDISCEIFTQAIIKFNKFAFSYLYQSGNFFLIAPFPGHCLLLPSYEMTLSVRFCYIDSKWTCFHPKIESFFLLLFSFTSLSRLFQLI